MKTREEVQEFLESILGNDRVYFQEPPNTGMKYPCIVYRFNRFYRRDADNKPYILFSQWEVHHMYKSIKYDLKDKFLFASPYVDFNRRLITDGVYNDYYTIHQ